MTTILCAYSGEHIKVQHFPLYLTSREACHPIFTVDASRLLTYGNKWADGELSPTDNYLLYLALFNSTGLVHFHVPAERTEKTASIIARNMARLFDCVDSMVSTSATQKLADPLIFPSFSISPVTKQLDNTEHWIRIWEDTYNEYYSSYKSSNVTARLSRLESTLERHIKDRCKEISTYAHTLAEWAEIAGEFPDWTIIDSAGTAVPRDVYWKAIIKACCKSESIWNVPKEHLTELIEHCEDYIPHGSIFAHTLMTLLRAGMERHTNFLNLGDIDISSKGTVFRILDANASVEDANKLALIDTAPQAAPVEAHYPTKLAFIRARMKYQMATDYRASLAILETTNTTLSETKAAHLEEGLAALTELRNLSDASKAVSTGTTEGDNHAST